jgi:hypothetical protein
MAQLSVFDKHQLAIARDTIKNPMKAKILGGMTVAEAHAVIEKFKRQGKIKR